MRAYLAARYTRWEELQSAVKDLEDRGVEVTAEWLKQPFLTSDNGVALPPDEQYLTDEAIRDVSDIAYSDVLVSFSDPEGAFVRGGKHVEFGLALGMGKRLVVIGRREVLFHYLDNVEVYPTWQDFLATISEAAAA